MNQQDKDRLRELAEVAKPHMCKDDLRSGPDDWVAFCNFHDACTPSRILSLLAENEELAAKLETIRWPKDTAEVRQFMHGNCQVEEHFAGEKQPHEDDRYLLTAHDFLSAVNWWADFPHHAAGPAMQPKGD